MKRFWTEARVRVTVGGGFGLELDGRPVRTPAGKALCLPTSALAQAVAEEWNRVEGEIDPRAMPLCGLANAAIDRVSPDPGSFASDLAQYAETDLICYRAQGPPGLIDWQEKQWGPLLDWARRRFDVDFAITSGIVHVPQPPATVERLRHEVVRLDPFRLAALSPLVTIGGSLIAGLGVIEGALSADAAWASVSLDDRWQEKKWGADDEAKAALAARRRDFYAAARFRDLLES